MQWASSYVAPCDKTHKLKLCQKLKLWWNSNRDDTQELKKWKKIKNVKKKNSNSKCDKTQILTKLENLNKDKTQYLDFEKTQKLKLWQNLKYDNLQFMKKKKTLK